MRAFLSFFLLLRAFVLKIAHVFYALSLYYCASNHRRRIRALDVSRGKQPEPGRVSVVLRERIEDEQP